jgi:hypothetical protein
LPDEDLMQMRVTTSAVWAVALPGLALWSMLAWGTGSVLGGGSDWLGTLLAQAIDSARREAAVLAAIDGFGVLGQVAVGVVWALGALGLMLSAVFATLLLRRRQDALDIP